MEKKYKIIKLTGSGEGTFSDRLTGNQRTDGDATLTNDNFIFSSPNIVYDDKSFDNGEFSPPLSREEINKHQINDEIKKEVKPKNNVLFSSLNEKVKNAVNNIINTFPGSIRSIPQDLNGDKLYNATHFSFNQRKQETTFKINTQSIRNPLNVIYHTDNEPINPEDFKKIKYFNVNYQSYVVRIGSEKYPILNVVLPSSRTNDYITLTVKGKIDFNPFVKIMEQLIYITPTDEMYDIYFNSISEFESFLLNRSTNPQFTSTFEILEEDTNGNLRINPVEATWPKIDEFNIDVHTIAFEDYIEKINDLSNAMDAYKTNLIERLLTSSSLHEFDTEGQKIGKLLNIYGFTFEKLKDRVDQIQYVRNVTYDKVKNIDDDLLPKFEQFVGLAKVGGFDIEDLYDFLIKRNESQFRGLSLQKTKKEKLLDFFRYLVINISTLYKSKGTSKAFKMLFSLMGLPDSFAEINEFTYKLLNQIDGQRFIDFREQLTSGSLEITDVIYNEDTDKYETVIDTQDAVSEILYPQFYKENQGTLRPNKPTNNSDFYFQDGAGWYRLTDNHKSNVVLDEDKSDLTATPKIIKTKFREFVYGERYFDAYRKFYNQNVGWDFSTKIDNIQSHPNADDTIFNRKNIEIFNNPANGVLEGLLSWYKRNDRLYFDVDLTSKTYEQFNAEIFKKGIGVGSGKYGRKYYDLHNTFIEYFRQEEKPFNYGATYKFGKIFTKNWTTLVENFVPSTTLWTGGDKIDNHNLHRQKFNWKDPHCIDVLDIDIPTKDELKEYLVEFIDEYKNHPDCYGRQYVYANWYYHLRINDDILTNDGWKFLYTTYENDNCDLLTLRDELISGGTHNVEDIQDGKVNLTCGFENNINCVGDTCVMGDKIIERLNEYNKFAFKKYILPYLNICDEQTLSMIIDGVEIDLEKNAIDDLDGCDPRELFRNLPTNQFKVVKEGVIELWNNNKLISPLEYFEKYGYFDAFVISGEFDITDCVDCQQKVKLTPINYCGICLDVKEFEFSLTIEVNEEYDDDLCDYRNYVYDDIPFKLEYVRLNEESIDPNLSTYGVYIKVRGGHRFDYKNDVLPYVLDFDVKYPKRYDERVVYLENQDRFYVLLGKNEIRSLVIYDQAGSLVRVKLRYDDCGDGITMYTPEYEFDMNGICCNPIEGALMGLSCNESRNTNLDKFNYSELPNCQAFMSGSKVYRLIAPYKYPVTNWSDIRIKDEDCERDIVMYTPEKEFIFKSDCDPIGATLMGTNCEVPREKCESNIEMLSPFYTEYFRTGLLCDLTASYTVGEYICKDENEFNVELVPVEEINDGDFILTADYFDGDLDYCDIADYHYGNFNNVQNFAYRLNMREVKGVGGVRIYKYVSINYDDIRLEHDHYVMINRGDKNMTVTAENLMIGDRILNFLEFGAYEVKHISNDDFCHKCYKDNYDYKYYLPINEDELILTQQNGNNIFLLDWCENHCNPLECVCLDDPFYFCIDEVEQRITINSL